MCLQENSIIFLKTQTSSFVQTLKQVSTRSSRQGITIGKYKAKAIQEDLGIFTHISAYSDISMHVHSARHSQAYLGIFRTLLLLTYSEPWFIQKFGKFRTRGIFRALVYLELWHIRNPGIFRTRGIFRTLVYSEPSHIQNPGVFCENSYILYEINIINSFNTCVIFTPIVFILCKKDVEAQGARAMNFDIP